MKKIIYTILILIALICIYTYYYFNDNVEFELIEEIEMIDSECLEEKNWYIVNKYVLDQENLYTSDEIDFQKYSIIISKGMKIKKIEYMKKGFNIDAVFSNIPIFKYKAIKVYVDTNSDSTKKYIYLIGDSEIYEDMRYAKEHYTIYD